MTRQLIHRFLAWTIDFGIIIIYAILLFTLTNSLFEIRQETIHPFFGQLIGFLTLTLPVISYMYLLETSKWKATIGKRLFKLTVLTSKNKTNKNILLRNILKFLPWELAHTGVHWIIYFESSGLETPTWTWFFLIVPQIIVIIYFLSIVISKGESSIYDRISATRLELKS